MPASDGAWPTTPIGLGIVGCGSISDAYLTGAARSRLVRVVACADLRPEAAAATAARHGVRPEPVDDLLADPAVAIVVNLTVPLAHAEISLAAIAAGKHVWSEKPLAATLAEGRAILVAAAARGVRVGCAPDTFLGAGHQAVRRAIDAGRIGRVVAGAATFATPGMEMWHPDPAFFFRRGGGPVLDVACYPITQLVNLLGPVASVTALASQGRTSRTITSAPRRGETVTVEVPTTVNAVLAFAAGANVALTASWDVWRHRRQPLELYGTEGSVLNPDPNFFGGTPQLAERGGDWQELATDGLPFGAPNRPTRAGTMVADYRMIGCVDMAAAIATRRPHRADGALALHVLEVMEAIGLAAAERRHVAIASACERPAPVPDGADEHVLLA
jgi:predicted dehydrogenase